MFFSPFLFFRFQFNNLYWHNSVDRDSESGCSGTDSGRGNSEEGECPHHGELNISHDHCGKLANPQLVLIDHNNLTELRT